MNTKYLLDQKNMWDKSAQDTTDRFLQIHFTDNFNPYESIFNELKYYLQFDDKKILEVGCGNGLILERIINQTKNADIYGIDISNNLIEEAKRAIPLFKNNLLVGDASKLPFEKEFFDTVYSNSIFQYFPDLSSKQKDQVLRQRFEGLREKTGQVLGVDWIESRFSKRHPFPMWIPRRGSEFVVDDHTYAPVAVEHSLG